jgi:hypothetical protein
MFFRWKYYFGVEIQLQGKISAVGELLRVNNRWLMCNNGSLTGESNFQAK